MRPAFPLHYRYFLTLGYIVNHSQSLLNLTTLAMKSQLDMANTLLQASRRIRQCQIEQIEASTHDCTTMLGQLEAIDDFEVLQKVQSSLLGIQVERICAYWNGLGSEWSATQADVAQRLQSLGGVSAEEMRHDFEKLQSDFSSEAGNVLKPFFEPGNYFSFLQYENPQADAGSSDSEKESYSNGHKGEGKRSQRTQRSTHA